MTWSITAPEPIVVFGDITFAQHSLPFINGNVLFDAILEAGALSMQTKKEIAAWLRVEGKLTHAQHDLAKARIDHIGERKKE